MRHKHSLSHYRLLTGDMGQILPCGLVEVLPGDMFRHSASVLVRFSPMAAPVMHPTRVNVWHFFVPHRLSWPSGYATTWEDFITGGPENKEANPLPSLSTTGVANDILDYLGLPVVAGCTVSSLPVRAFNLIFNEWFRDQDLQTERGLEDLGIPNVNWSKDYYTTARPWPQKGDDVTLPLGTRAPVVGLGKTSTFYSSADVAVYETDATGTRQYAKGSTAHGDQDHIIEEDLNNPGHPNVWADLSQAAAAKVNDLRRAFALQRFAEARARYGSRYTEYLRYLGVRPADARLQRPEFLGGGSQPVAVSEVLQTANDVSERFGVGDMYGHGIAATRSNAYRRRFQEHGYVISMMSVRPKIIYTNGIERTWSRRDREDFWQRELQHIGQQEVMQTEVFAEAGDANSETVFGWSDRYAEYRRQRSGVAGEFRNTLDYWHLARQFSSSPVLNNSFVECVPSKRIFQDQSGTHTLWCAVNHRLVARRLVSRSASGRII